MISFSHKTVHIYLFIIGIVASTLPAAPAHPQLLQELYSDDSPTTCYMSFANPDAPYQPCQSFMIRQDTVAGNLLWNFSGFDSEVPIFMIVTEGQQRQGENGIPYYRVTDVISEGVSQNMGGICAHLSRYSEAVCSLSSNGDELLRVNYSSL
ncbi:MAG: hypothetical protein AB8B99_23260 [Phormidesmis sp.]